MKFYLFISSVTAIFTACYTPRYVYSPPASNIPVLIKKGDSKLAAYYSTSPFSNTNSKAFFNNGFDIQAAYAAGSHWALLASQTNRYEKNSGDFNFFLSDSAVIRYSRHITEFGGGYFGPVRKGSQLFVQLMAGMGAGKFTMDDNGRNASNQYYSRYHRVQVTKLFLQPALQLQYNRYFNTSFASRFSLLWYHGVKTNYTPAEQEAFLLNELTGLPRLFWEPVIVNSFTFKKLRGFRFELQLGFASLVSHHFVDYRSVNLSMGAMVDFSKLKKRSN